MGIANRFHLHHFLRLSPSTFHSLSITYLALFFVLLFPIFYAHYSSLLFSSRFYSPLLLPGPTSATVFLCYSAFHLAVLTLLLAHIALLFSYASFSSHLLVLIPLSLSLSPHSSSAHFSLHFHPECLGSRHNDFAQNDNSPLHKQESNHIATNLRCPSNPETWRERSPVRLRSPGSNEGPSEAQSAIRAANPGELRSALCEPGFAKHCDSHRDTARFAEASHCSHNSTL